jgi:DNA-binding IclR family transcriptional regulator
MTNSTHHIQSLFTTFQIIDALRESESMRVVQIAQETGIAKSSVFKHLDTLQQLGYVTKNGPEYSLSLRWFQIGRQTQTQHGIIDTVKPELDQFARQTGETISLVVEEDGDAVYLYQTSDRREHVSPVPEGGRIPCPISIGGKAILAYRPEAEVERLLDESDVQDGTDQLFNELVDLRDQRLATELNSSGIENINAGDVAGHRHISGDAERYRDINSVAVPVRNDDGDAVAAVEVSGRESSLTRNRLEDEVASLLVEVAESLEVELLRTSERRDG